MTHKSQHVVKRSGSWAVRSSGAEKASRIFPTKSDAISYAKNLAKKHAAILYVHKEDGTVIERNSYGNPCLSRG